jgi:ABC-type molybdate transport system substrate-binding protein
MACDVYYLTVVGEHFQEAVNVSDTDIVIAVPEGNPAGIETLRDLTKKPSSAMLVPAVATGHADATLAYRTDTLAEADKVDAISIDSAHAKAIQPYTIAKQSQHKELARRLYRRIAESGDRYRELGFNFRR